MNKIQKFLQAHRKAAWAVLGVIVVLALASIFFGTN